MRLVTAIANGVFWRARLPERRTMPTATRGLTRFRLKLDEFEVGTELNPYELATSLGFNDGEARAIVAAAVGVGDLRFVAKSSLIIQNSRYKVMPRR